MSKEVVKDRKQAAKAATDLQAMRRRFSESKDISAKDCRQLSEVNGAPTVDVLVEQGWVKVVGVIKDAAGNGHNCVQVPAGPTTHPDVKAKIVQRLDKAGFRHELVGVTGYIYW